MFIVQVNDNEGILKELVHVGCDRQVAEYQFFGACEQALSNWDEYTSDNHEEILSEGYAKFGCGAVMLIDTDGVTSDDEISALLGNSLPKSVEKITRWVQDGEIGSVDTISEVLEQAGICLDAASSHDICGELLFQAEDGEWYVGTVELVIVKAHPDYLKDTLAEADDRNIDIGKE